jgi:peptidase A4-like protein
MKSAVAIAIVICTVPAWAGEPSRVSAVPAPPPGYDASVASPVLNHQFKLPPEPDRLVAPRMHEAWHRAMTAPRHERPLLAPSPVMHNPAKHQAVPQNGTASPSTMNWSGTAVTGGAFAQHLAITAMFVVPTPRVPFDTCDGTEHWASYWPGIDGFNNQEVLQGGIDQEVSCIAGQTTSYTMPWVEWYPAGAVGVSSPAVNPGDVVFVEVWNTSPTVGYVFFYNYSTDQSGEYEVSAPAGVTLKGASVEWIVERPGITPLPLANFIAMPWSQGVAWEYASPSPTYQMGGDPNPNPGTLQRITMVDNSGNPISSATVENQSFLWFQNSGSSCGVNQQPC